MKYGFFDDMNREYVITTPKTPLPWINYLSHILIISLNKHIATAPLTLHHKCIKDLYSNAKPTQKIRLIDASHQ